MKFPSSYGLNSLTGSLPKTNLIRHTLTYSVGSAALTRSAHAVRLILAYRWNTGAIRPVSRRKPCPNGLNSPAGFSTKPANPNSRHADGYSYRSHAKIF